MPQVIGQTNGASLQDPCGTENSFISHTVKVNQKLDSVLGLGLLMWVVCV